MVHSNRIEYGIYNIYIHIYISGISKSYCADTYIYIQNAMAYRLRSYVLGIHPGNTAYIILTNISFSFMCAFGVSIQQYTPSHNQ